MYYYVYILANHTNSTVHTGITNDLLKRLWEHRNHVDPKHFTERYNVEKLAYFEQTKDISPAIKREKESRGWARRRKNKLIERRNPNWVDLLDRITG